MATCHTLRLQSRELDTTIAESGEKDRPVMSSPCPCKMRFYLNAELLMWSQPQCHTSYSTHNLLTSHKLEHSLHTTEQKSAWGAL